MASSPPMTRFLSICLTVGGVIGMLLSALSLPSSAFKGFSPFVVMACFLILSTLSAFAGMSLWKGAKFGIKSAPWIFLAQTPILTTSPLTYSWFSGARFGPTYFISEESSGFNMAVNFGTNFELLLNSHVPATQIGANIFALAAFLYLVRPNNSFKPT